LKLVGVREKQTRTKKHPGKLNAAKKQKPTNPNTPVPKNI
jgi:hypothetical protein